MSSGPRSWFFFSSRYFQSCVVDKLGHVTHHQLAKHLLTIMFLSAQLSALSSVSMEGIVQLLTLAPVMWGGLERSVKQVHTVYSHCKSTISI